jgi:hypothetical protein
MRLLDLTNHVRSSLSYYIHLLRVLTSTGHLVRSGVARGALSEGISTRSNYPRTRAIPFRIRNRIYRLRWPYSRFSALSNLPATAGVLKSPVRISRFVASRP